MKTFNYINKSFNYLSNEKINICLGFFDGIHLGHQKLINTALKEGSKLGLMTFFSPFKREDVLTSLEDKKNLLEKMGVDYLFILDFKDVKNYSPEVFINEVLKPLNINKIYVGRDYSFGKGGIGKVDLLKSYFDVEEVDFAYDKKGNKISSSSIISYIENGEIEKANRDLNRFYSIKGKVEHGFHNGTSILEIPIANITPKEEYVFPKCGVYATNIFIEGIKYPSMTNIGVHPTISKLDRPDIETNIFAMNRDLYSQDVILEFVSYIREEKKFDSVDDLVKQIKEDKKIILKILDK